MEGHDDIINFMSSYQCQDKSGKHYHPRGFLCWYECNRYGDPTGVVHLIKKVPEFIWIYNFSERGYQRMKKDQEKQKKLNEKLSSEPGWVSLNTSDAKPVLHQNSHRQDIKEYRRRVKNADNKETGNE